MAPDGTLHVPSNVHPAMVYPPRHAEHHRPWTGCGMWGRGHHSLRCTVWWSGVWWPKLAVHVMGCDPNAVLQGAGTVVAEAARVQKLEVA